MATGDNYRVRAIKVVRSENLCHEPRSDWSKHGGLQVRKIHRSVSRSPNCYWLRLSKWGTHLLGGRVGISTRPHPDFSVNGTVRLGHIRIRNDNNAAIDESSATPVRGREWSRPCDEVQDRRRARPNQQVSLPGAVKQAAVSVAEWHAESRTNVGEINGPLLPDRFPRKQQ